MKQKLSKKEALKEAQEWWIKLSYKKHLLYKKYYYPFNLLTIYLSEHPDITIVEPLTLFEKAENLWQNLNAVVLLDSKVDFEFFRQVLIENKPSKDDK